MTILDASQTRPTEGGVTFELRHRILRGVWGGVWLIFAAWTPAPLHRWRVFLLQLFGASIHPTAHVYSSARIWYPPNLFMAEHACIGPRVQFYCMAPITLGPRAIVSQGAHLCAGSHDIDDPHHQLFAKPITVCEGAWVAADAFIGPGVTVGAGAVVGARAVLFKNAEPNGVYTGNPAQLLRSRRIRSKKVNA